VVEQLGITKVAYRRTEPVKVRLQRILVLPNLVGLATGIRALSIGGFKFDMRSIRERSNPVESRIIRELDFPVDLAEVNVVPTPVTVVLSTFTETVPVSYGATVRKMARFHNG
jgi:hypothetical protein